MSRTQFGDATSRGGAPETEGVSETLLLVVPARACMGARARRDGREAVLARARCLLAGFVVESGCV